MKRQGLVIWGLALVAFSACTDSDGENAADDAGSEEEPAPLATEPAPELDVDTLTADTPAGTVDAERKWENTYVGAVTEELYIAISFSDGADAGQPEEATVYLCDGSAAEYLTGEVGPETTTLEGDTLDVELSLAENGVQGTVLPENEEALPFEATEASGVAGLYTAEFTFEDHDYRPRWIVLPDGSQRGQACWRCCGRICTICCCTTTSCLRKF